ncbi:MAG: bifunctional diaminohydroxyphosphoribosylaminopyrimidine deaminase/5-amino-6-(5-phosphoribosylamino)uracil reductase RibD [Butyrivibrio sp.]|nr:bifunctional diaminohydroxyphosphoribosylaminopyrimidine deaminase/5-amino-6-(5-phosphoribosylamino)uracil reductase RibD [Butyrivibrio sp.]
MEDKEYMALAIELAKTAEGRTNPNPLVGAVIVKDGRIIGKGCHERYGELHAERNAIKSLNEPAEGATIFVTLEPCCHHGKQPPCTEAILESGIKKVVIGSRDPNPLVSGKGTKFLREHGIEVVEDFMREECDEINPVFFHYITNKKPYIALKYAMTADGKIATKSGDSKWITGEAARSYVHRLRNYYAGILVGIGTVLADDPMLNCRLGEINKDEEEYRNPVRIVLDSDLRIPMDSKLVKTAKDIPVIVACLKGVDIDKKKALEENGVQIIEVPLDKSIEINDDNSRDIYGIQKHKELDINYLMNKLGDLQIDGILVEGGSSVNASVLKAGAAQKIYIFVGSKVFGGAGALSPVADMDISKVSESVQLERPKVQVFEDDILIEYEVKTCLQA